MISVAYQGEPGAFSEQAARALFGRRARLLAMENLEEVFTYASGPGSRRGVVPIENSVFGSVHETYDLLLRHPLSITDELILRIRHHLMALPGVRIQDVGTVVSHPQAIGQCSEFLRSLRKARIVFHADTAGAAKMIREQADRHAAAVASAHAARLYRLRILKRGIENDRKNYTRFLVLARKAMAPGGRGKTSLAFALRNIPGALFKSLAVFALRDINLLKIESRPLVGRPWEYLFYADLDGSIRENRVAEALNHLKEVATFVKILGSYRPGKVIHR